MFISVIKNLLAGETYLCLVIEIYLFVVACGEQMMIASSEMGRRDQCKSTSLALYGQFTVLTVALWTVVPTSRQFTRIV